MPALPCLIATKRVRSHQFKSHHACRAVPNPTPSDRSGSSQISLHLALPALPFRSLSWRFQPRSTPPRLPSRCLSRQIRPLHTSPCLPFRSTSLRSRSNLETPKHACLAEPPLPRSMHASPRLPCRALPALIQPCHVASLPTLPFLPCRSTLRLIVSEPVGTCRSCRALLLRAPRTTRASSRSYSAARRGVSGSVKWMSRFRIASM